MEVFNWGTFDGRVWTLHPGGRNSLLTGDIGGRGYHPAGAGPPGGLQQGGGGVQPGAGSAFLCAGLLQVRPQRSQRHRQAGGPSGRRQLLGAPRRLPQRGLRSDGDPRPGLLEQGPAGPAGPIFRCRGAGPVN
ncbi:MAG: ATP-binding protein [Chromatiaceae bacterium]